ncbi:MAG: APC family permease [Thermotogae bacterium]|jgi:amino acid transporter|nr:APC family permease [Thermotogota bacterium]
MTLKDLKRFFVGPPLSNKSISREKLPVWKALAIFSSDALSSVAYGPEEMIIMLMAGGALMYTFAIPIGLAIIALVIIVSISYAQVARANPSGGGSYSAAKTNIGEMPALLAAASLLVDYTLTVAVSVSAGTDAITSAFPSLLPYHLVIDLGVLFLVLMVINLRGVRESSSVFVFPTYAFVFGIIVTIIVGIIFTIVGKQPAISPSEISGKVAINGFVIFLIMRAFANGSSSMTGIEAISNGVPMFKKPEVKNAQKTTYLLAMILVTMFAGIVFLYVHYRFLPEQENTMLSQLAETVFGRGLFYYYVQATTMLILYLAANTAYNGLPPLLALLAKDGYMPRYLSARGDRLSFSGGIIFLSFLAAAFMIIFDGYVDELISLYALGVFISFTIAQTSMVVHWNREKGRKWITSAIINGFGAIITATVVIVIIVAKFMLGAWIVTILIPAIMIWFFTVRKHYENMREQLRLPPQDYVKIKLAPYGENIVVVPVSGVSKVVENTIKYARMISKDVRALYVSVDENSSKEIVEKWKDWNPGIQLVVKYSPYRTVIEPILEYINEIRQKKNPEDFITVLIPEFETKRFWHRSLHNQTSWILRRYLVHEKDVVISVVPYQLKK